MWTAYSSSWWFSTGKYTNACCCSVAKSCPTLCDPVSCVAFLFYLDVTFSNIKKQTAWSTEKTDFLFRITKILIALDGPNWREKLPPIPAVPTSAQVRAWRPVVETPPDQVGDSCCHPQPGMPGRGSLHSFLLRVTVSCAYYFSVEREDKCVISGVRPGFKFKTLLSLCLTA